MMFKYFRSTEKNTEEEIILNSDWFISPGTSKQSLLFCARAGHISMGL